MTYSAPTTSAPTPAATDCADHAASHTGPDLEPRSQPSTSTARSATSKHERSNRDPDTASTTTHPPRSPRTQGSRGLCRPAPTQPGQLLICEGIPDALIAAQAGYRSVGLLGTNALDPTVATRIANIATRDNLDITIITDNDDNGVGKHLGQQLAERLGDEGLAVTTLEPPEGHDLSTWARATRAWARQLGHDRPAEQLTRGDLGATGLA